GAGHGSHRTRSADTGHGGLDAAFPGLLPVLSSPKAAAGSTGSGDRDFSLVALIGPARLSTRVQWVRVVTATAHHSSAGIEPVVTESAELPRLVTGCHNPLAKTAAIQTPETL